jgi:hypothetical protein
MPWQPDLKPCTALPVVGGEQLLAVGWLSREHPFPTGPTPRAVYERLREFINDPWQPFVTPGSHNCELCQFDGEACGSANLFIPAANVLYVAPELVVHYINAHFYRPPEVFCAAVLACPAMRSPDYRQALLACHAVSMLKAATQGPT